MKKLKVLVVDDSKIFRELLAAGINSDPALEVVATASNVYEARDAIIETMPDVMTLDVEMPGMSGIEFLKRLLPQYSIPTVMVSSLNSAVFDAMAAGAVDFVSKPAGTGPEVIDSFIKNELNVKIKIAAIANIAVINRRTMRSAAQLTGKDGRVIAIGASTGGTEATLEVVRGFDTDMPGAVIVQHMPAGFTAMYAERLDRECRVSVREAKDGDAVTTGTVLVAPGERQMRLMRAGDGYVVKIGGEEKVSGHCPSVDVLFESVARAAGRNAIGVILTGMGADGAEGLLKMRKSGAVTIGEKESSCVVYGMPKAAKDRGAVEEELALEDIAPKIYDILRQ